MRGLLENISKKKNIMKTKKCSKQVREKVVEKSEAGFHLSGGAAENREYDKTPRLQRHGGPPKLKGRELLEKKLL